MEVTQSHLDQILDAIASLSLEDQEILLNVVKQRHIEKKREQILLKPPLALPVVAPQ